MSAKAALVERSLMVSPYMVDRDCACVALGIRWDFGWFVVGVFESQRDLESWEDHLRIRTTTPPATSSTIAEARFFHLWDFGLARLAVQWHRKVTAEPCPMSFQR